MSLAVAIAIADGREVPLCVAVALSRLSSRACVAYAGGAIEVSYVDGAGGRDHAALCGAGFRWVLRPWRGRHLHVYARALDARG